MMSGQGVGVIPKSETIEERQFGGTIYFSFALLCKDPYKEKGSTQWVRMSVSVPKEFVEDARKTLTPGRVLYVRIGELRGTRNEKGTVFMTLNSRWKWIEPLNAIEGPERKNYKDE